MAEEFSIERMSESDVHTALDWALREGWNPGLSDAQCFYQADPKGFFKGILEGEVIATGAGVVYDENYAFCGLYIVKPEFRSQGYGIQLTQERLKYVGDRITGLDGVLDKVSKYQRLGYVSAHKNSRFELKNPISVSNSSKVIDLKTIPFEELEKFDRKYFPAPRSAFLRCWINQAHSIALGYLEGNRLQGYGVIRKCHEGYKIGPLFAESPVIAESIFETLISKVFEGPIYLDVPEINLNAQALVKKYGMLPKFEVIRMYRNGTPDIDMQGIYGITTFELG